MTSMPPAAFRMPHIKNAAPISNPAWPTRCCGKERDEEEALSDQLSAIRQTSG
jgi:hypothetical protein